MPRQPAVALSILLISESLRTGALGGKRSHVLLLEDGLWKVAPLPWLSLQGRRGLHRGISRGDAELRGWLFRGDATRLISESLENPFDSTYYSSVEGIQIVDIVRIQLESLGHAEQAEARFLSKNNNNNNVFRNGEERRQNIAYWARNPSVCAPW